MSLTDKLRAALRDFFGGTRPRGYLYVPAEDADALGDVAPGREIRAARKGPWLVVDHELSSIVVARWPGQLWLVEIGDAMSKAELKALGAELRDDAPYTRACRVTVIENVPIAMLFGPQGDAVVKVIDAARSLTMETAARLSAARDAGAAKAQNRLWTKWLSNPTLPAAASGHHDFDGTLSLGPKRSPVGHGLSIIHAEVGRRAEAVAGKTVWISETGSDDVWLSEPWSTASSALLDAALAFGVPELPDDDRAILSKAWWDVFGEFE